ncbi:MAG: hypothetical protein GY854_21430 [Deltaproteobacteria bacterium]|nr:hypothetical protein [Deltaproteobacteria bacterium]
MQRFNFVLVALGFMVFGCVSENCDCSGLDTNSDDVSSDDAGEEGAAYELPFQPSNVDVDLPPSEAINDIIFRGDSCAYSGGEINTDTCELECVDIDDAACVIATQSDETEIAVLIAAKFEIDENIRVKITGQRPLMLISTDEVNIRGTLMALDDIYSNKGHAGGYNCTSASGAQNGNGPGGGGAGYDSAGAGGGGYCGFGGQGGEGEDGLQSPGEGGSSYGNAEIIPLKGGSAGGKGPQQYGGGGGGAIQIVSAASISVHSLGIISMPGNHGDANAGNGGGSGGAILLEAPEVEISGVLAVNGGGAGAGDLHSDGVHGQPSDSPAQGGTDDVASNGGNGSGADIIDGQPGESYEKLWSAGGGGGGAGWIRINTSDGAAEITGIVSPSMSSDCASLGTL